MPFDAAVTVGGVAVILVEVDGSHHFDSDFNTTMRNDVAKEKGAVERGILVVRLHQNDVRHRRFDWKLHLKQMVTSALSGGLEVKIDTQPGQSAYTSGIYASKRA